MDDDHDYKFDIEDVGPEVKSAEETGEASNDNATVNPKSDGSFDISNVRHAFSYTNLVVLPLNIFAVYAFLKKDIVVAALTSLFGGASGLATAVGTAAWAIGGVIIAFIGTMVLATVALFIVGLVTQNRGKLGLGLVGIIYFGLGYAGATSLFGDIPVLVAFIIVTNIFVWALIGSAGSVALLIAIYRS